MTSGSKSPKYKLKTILTCTALSNPSKYPPAKPGALVCEPLKKSRDTKRAATPTSHQMSYKKRAATPTSHQMSYKTQLSFALLTVQGPV
jgi:hypothetical protein